MKGNQNPSITGIIEASTASKKPKLSDQQIAILKSAAEVVLALGVIAGGLAIALVAPNALKYLGKVPRYKYSNADREGRFKNRQKAISRSIYYLKRNGYIELVPNGEDFLMKVTSKGKSKIKRLNFEHMKVPSKDRWNGHWWFVLADVPSKPYRKRADLFREKLKEMGFYALQRTVWVFPFDPKDQVQFTSAYFGIEKFVTILEGMNIDSEDEDNLKSFFKEKTILKEYT